MLARNFMSSQALGITEQEHQALVKVLGMLERDELPHVVDKKWAFVGGGFSMNVEECGTVRCIGGWVAHFLHRDPIHYVGDTWEPNDERDGLAALYWPNYCINSFDDITPPQAAAALRNYLATGEPNWREVLA